MRTVACALQTYSKVGGLQSFNRRLFQNLGRRALDAGELPVRAFVDDDADVALPTLPGVELVAPKSRLAFFAGAFWSGVFEADALLVCHINLLPLAIAVRLFRPRLPIVLFVHGFEAWNSQNRPRKLSEHLFLKAVTRIVSVSRYTAAVMSREFGVPLEKFRILPNAVDHIGLEVPAPARRPFSILTVTRLSAGERAKNVHEMIAAVAALRKVLPDVSYEIIGEGALRPELEALTRELGVDDVVSFRGLVDVETLQAAYASACVFAMPSDKEGFGIVYLEAWQYGLPVICSIHGAASEVVTDGVEGFVVDPADISTLTARLHDLLSKPDFAREMGERGRQKVEAKYLNANFRVDLSVILDELDDPEGEGAVARRHSQLKF
ncbi:glycosyltransferase family 4 protein [Methylocella silvestris]|nr:glycosyltransferase family 4 protein [Methylocella silvestris]